MPGHAASGGARIHFRDPVVIVRSTDFARPVDGNIGRLDLNDVWLTEGDSGRVDVRMTATADPLEPADFFFDEPIAAVASDSKN